MGVCVWSSSVVLVYPTTDHPSPPLLLSSGEMLPQKKKKKQKQDEMGGIAADRISQLPDAVLLSILSLLPVDEAASTTTLSKRWRHLFSSVPDLEFCHYPRSYGRPPPGVPDDDFFLQIVLDVLDRRRGPINFCKILFYSDLDFDDALDRITRSLCALGIRDLYLLGANYLVPSYILSCTTLKRLALAQCRLDVSPDFAGLPNLRSLELTWLIITGSEIELIVSRCPALEELKLQICCITPNLRIRSNSLSVLEVNTEMPSNISIEEAPCLSSVCIYLDDDFLNEDAGYEGASMAGRLVKLLEGLCCVESLKFNLGHLGRSTLRKQNLPLPKSLTARHHLFKLNKLFFGLDPHDEYLLSILSCILISSPSLQELIIDEHVAGYPPSPWDQNYCFECAAKWPATTTLHTQIKNLKHWIAFIKYVVMNASTRKKITIVCESIEEMEPEELSASENIRQWKPLLAPHIDPDTS